MLRNLRIPSLLCALLCVLPASAADPMPKKDKDGDELVKAGTTAAKILSVEGPGKVIRLEVMVPVPNQGAFNELMRLNMLPPPRNANEAIQRSQQIAQQKANLYKLEARNLEVQPADDLKVRAKFPPIAFDDKGNVKKYTAKELKELKGDDPKAPGYQADFDSLKPGQFVTVSLMQKKKMRPKPGEKKEAEFLNDNALTASEIMIEAEPKGP